MMTVAKPASVAIFEMLFEMWPAPKMKSARLRNNRLDENTQLAAADQSVVVGGILPEAEIHMARTLGLHHFARDVPDFRFHASAADGAEHGPVLANQQLGAFIARNGPVDLHDSGQRAFLAEAPEADHFLVNIHSIELYRGAGGLVVIATARRVVV